MRGSARLPSTRPTIPPRSGASAAGRWIAPVACCRGLVSRLVPRDPLPFGGGADGRIGAGVMAAEIVALVVTPIVFVGCGQLHRRACPEGIHVGLDAAEVLAHLESPAVHGLVPVIGYLLPDPLGPIAVLAASSAYAVALF